MFDFDITLLSNPVLWTAVLIFGLRVIDVSMGTIRTIMIMRGMRKWATLIGFVEVTIWVVAISQVITNLDNVWSILAYSGGFATGTLVGMWLEDRLALGNVDLHIVSLKKGAEIADKIRKAGYGATEMPAYGRSGPVLLVESVVPRKKTANILDLITMTDPDAFVTVEDMRLVVHGHGRLAK